MNRTQLALCQRILPAFRVPVWRKLSQIPWLDLTVFHGKGYGSGSTAESGEQEGLQIRRLHTLPIQTKGKYRVIHPGLVRQVTAGHFDVVLSEGLTYFPNSLHLALTCKKKGIPFLLYEAPPAGGDTLIRRFLAPMYRRFSYGIVTYNSWGVEYYTRHGFPREKITVALNTIDTEGVLKRVRKFKDQADSLRNSLELHNKLVVGYIGALESRKKVDVLVKSLVQILNRGIQISGLFIGDGPDKASLESLVPENLKRHFHFVGRHTSDAEKYLQLCSVVVLPSQGGLAVPHGLTCGIPCIATQEAEGPGIRDYISHGVNGYVMETHGLASSLPNLLSKMATDPQLLSSLASGALRSRVAFSVDQWYHPFQPLCKKLQRAGDVNEGALRPNLPLQSWRRQ